MIWNHTLLTATPPLLLLLLAYAGWSEVEGILIYLPCAVPWIVVFSLLPLFFQLTVPGAVQRQKPSEPGAAAGGPSPQGVRPIHPFGIMLPVGLLLPVLLWTVAEEVAKRLPS